MLGTFPENFRHRYEHHRIFWFSTKNHTPSRRNGGFSVIHQRSDDARSGDLPRAVATRRCCLPDMALSTQGNRNSASPNFPPPICLIEMF